MQLFFILGLFFSINAFSQKLHYNIGITLRNASIDIQNTPFASTGTLSNFYNEVTFWRVKNLKNEVVIEFNKKFGISVENYLRYNHVYYIDKISRDDPTYLNRKQKKRLKTDVFINGILNRQYTSNFNILLKAGLGLTNINTKYDVTYYDTIIAPTGFNIYASKYKGDFFKFTPKVEIAFEYKKIAFGIEAILVDDASLKGLKA